LIAVCVLHALSPLLIRGIHAGLGADETVYVSQIDPHAIAGAFSAPRSRGLTLLTAPASFLSPSIAVLRVWLSLLSGVGLYLGCLPWLRLRKGYVVSLAALLWSSLWVSIFYSFEAMPNQYVAYGALMTMGWALLALQHPDRRRYLAYAAVSIGFTALMRPTDSVLILLTLLGATLVARDIATAVRRRLAAVLLLSWIVGLSEWVVEAYVRFGGPIQRFDAARAQNVGGLHWSLGRQADVLAGPLLCRNGCSAAAPLTAQLWWFALIPLVALGIHAARHRSGHLTLHVIAVIAAAALAGEYLMAIGYAAPRFLEPTYLLLALPAAEGVRWLITRATSQARPILAITVVAVLSVQAVGQLHIANTLSHGVDVKVDRVRAIAAALRSADVRPPCMINGHDAAQVAFLTGCRAASHDPGYEPSAAEIDAQAIAVIAGSHAEPAPYFASWPECRITIADQPIGSRVWIHTTSTSRRPGATASLTRLAAQRLRSPCTSDSRIMAASHGSFGGAGGPPR
jgi:hypothetical protein